MVCASGCVREHQGFSFRSESEEVKFEVDEVQYIARRHVGEDAQRRVTQSWLVIYPWSVGYTHSPSLKEETSYQRTVITTWDVEGKDVVAKTDTLYFFQEGKIVLEKKYQDLGIDAQRLNADIEEVRDYLYPILEKLIRENVPPQEPEREEPL